MGLRSDAGCVVSTHILLLCQAGLLLFSCSDRLLGQFGLTQLQLKLLLLQEPLKLLVEGGGGNEDGRGGGRE